MTKPLSAAQKAANKKARIEKSIKDTKSRARDLAKDRKPAKKAKVDRASRMPTKTAKQRAQAEAVRLFDSGGSITHDPSAMMAMQIDPPHAPGKHVSVGEDMAAETRGKLDMESREQPLTGVRGRVAPKPAPAAAARTARSKTAAPASGTLEKLMAVRELKYVDAGEGHPHRFSGRNWDGVLYRSANGTLGLERSTDEGETWTRYLSDEEFVSRDRWDLGRAIQRSTKEKSHDIKGRRVAGAVAKRAPSALGATLEEGKRSGRKIIARDGELVKIDGAPQPRRSRAPKPAPAEGASDAVQSEELRTVWKRREPVTTCEWGHGDIMKGQKPCTATSTRRVVCNSGRNFVDVCDRHEKAYLTTKSSRWVGCVSYQLTPTGPKLDGATSKNETPAEQAVSV